MPPQLKAAETLCKGCGTTIPAQESGPGRPRIFCTRLCRTEYYRQQERELLERELAEERERQAFERDVWYHGKREAKRRAKLRAGGES
jgi:hypothetical protein